MATAPGRRKARRKPKSKRAAADRKAAVVCRTVKKTRKVKGKRKTVKQRVCARPKTKAPAGHKPVKPAYPPKTAPAPPPGAPQPAASPAAGPVPQHTALSARDAERLLWRAGFGPRPGDVERFAAMGLDGAVDALLNPPAAEQLQGPEPVDDDGAPLKPLEEWGHDHLWWLDRMVRTSRPLVERMTLVWHDWLATSRDDVQVNLMLDQNALLRRHALGSFGDLLRDVTIDPAMLRWLNGIDNTRSSPNENYARELMELFSLGANRGAYTEADVRQAARALTGWRADWSEELDLHNFRFVASRHDTGIKTIFGQSGAFGWQDVVRLCVEHPLHPSYFVTKLWGYFIPTPPDAATQAALQEAYVSSGRQVKPVLSIILKHPALYRGPAMVKPPVVFCAGLLRALGRGVDTAAWSWLSDGAGQVLFRPPSVAGWDADRWLGTSTWQGRWQVAAEVLQPTQVNPWVNPATYSATEDGAAALAKAHAHLGSPTLTPETTSALRAFADTCLPTPMASWQHRPYRAMRQNALRLLIATSADYQTC